MKTLKTLLALATFALTLAAPVMAGDAGAIMQRCGALAGLTSRIAQLRDMGDNATAAEALQAPHGNSFPSIPAAEWKPTLDTATTLAYKNPQLTPEQLYDATFRACIGPLGGPQQGEDDRPAP